VKGNAEKTVAAAIAHVVLCCPDRVYARYEEEMDARSATGATKYAPE
jgi:hypothetical protein